MQLPARDELLLAGKVSDLGLGFRVSDFGFTDLWISGLGFRDLGFRVVWEFGNLELCCCNG